MNGGIAQFGLVIAGRPVFTDFTYAFALVWDAYRA